MKTKFIPGSFNDMPLDKYDTRELAIWAVTEIARHEKTCATRWGVLVRLMWGCLASMSVIFTTVAAAIIVHALHIGGF